MLALRDYQQRLVTDISAALRTERAVFASLATGGGKTVVFSSIIHDTPGACLAVVHRREIIVQISAALAALEVKHRVIAPPDVVKLARRRHLQDHGRSYVDPNAAAAVASVQTLASKASGRNQQLQRYLATVQLAVWDEGHHYTPSGVWAKAVESVGNAKLLFVTATPERADGKALNGWADTLITGPQTQELIDAGWLSPFIYKAPETDLKVDDIPVTGSGDFNAKAFRERVVDSHLVGDVLRHYQAFGSGGRAIVFATDVATSDDIAQRFTDAGIRARSLHGGTDAREREQALEDFRSGKLRVLVNVDLFDEGFDVPAADICIMARPTYSLAKFLQMVGRVLRPVYADGWPLDTPEQRKAAIAAGPKPHAVIIDAVGNWERGHGLPNWPRRWSLDGVERDPPDPNRVCTTCTQPYFRYLPGCPWCGAPVPAPAAGARSTPEMVEGDLYELDLEAMTALFKAQQRADMSDEEYQQDMIARGVPQIGRAAGLRRHQADKYRREVLRQLVGWWYGCQPADRTDSEKHKRFFYRFGIDLGTIYTLKAKETDALIKLIQQRFTDDI